MHAALEPHEEDYLQEEPNERHRARFETTSREKLTHAARFRRRSSSMLNGAHRRRAKRNYL